MLYRGLTKAYMVETVYTARDESFGGIKTLLKISAKSSRKRLSGSSKKTETAMESDPN